MSDTPGDGRDNPQSAIDAPAPPPMMGEVRGSGRGGLQGFLGNLAAGARLLFFRRTDPLRFRADANQLIALVALGVVVNVAAGVAFVGTDGFFDFHALPSAVFGILLALVAGHVIGGILRTRQPAMLIPVAVASAALTLNVIANCAWLAVDHGWIPLRDGVNSVELYNVLVAWWAAATLLAVARIAGGGARGAALPVLVFAAVVLVPTYFLPPGWLWGSNEAEDSSGDRPRSFAAVAEATFYAQPGLLQAALEKLRPQRPGIPDLYFVGFAPYASQDVFMKEMNSVESLLRERFDTGGRGIMLVNHASLVDRMPIASLTSLRQALRAVGRRIDPAEDIVLLHITTHGSETHELSTEFWPLQLAQIRPADLRSALDDAGIKWRIVVVSACYSGGFIEALKDPDTLVMTAADAKHTSFGCGDDSEYTYFSRALFDEALRQTHSFADAFVMARAWIREREVREGLDPSNPQMSMGAALAQKLPVLQRRLAGGEAAK
jgi:hypothetical protein